jgi:hypothetical protein
MGAAGICIAVTSLNRKNSISNSFYGDEKTPNKTGYHLKMNHLAELAKLIRLAQVRYLGTAGSTGRVGLM